MTFADQAWISGIAAALLGAPVDGVEPVRGTGRNSRVYRLRRGDDKFALKIYPSDGRDRLHVEEAALRLMARYGIDCVPRVIAADTAHCCALLEWIDGDPLDDIGADDIDAAAAFLAAVHTLRQTPEAASQPSAAEACLCGAEIVTQIERRLARLADVADTEPALAAFLPRLRRLAAEICLWADAECERHGLSFARPLPAAARTLCPADFGFHNALRRRDGRLVFVDFDYFGWDDPVKLTADFLLHPGMRLDDAHKRRFVAAVGDIFGADRDFAHRLRILYPLFALRWCAILLNEFLPERWALRRHAAAAGDWEIAKSRQLDRAAQLMHSLNPDFRRFPYG